MPPQTETKPVADSEAAFEIVDTESPSNGGSLGTKQEPPVEVSETRTFL